MNRLQLRTNLRRYLAEAGSARFTDADLNEELNRSARSLAGQHGLIQADVTGITDPQGRLVVPGLVNVQGAIRYGSSNTSLPVMAYGDVFNLDQRGWQASGAPRALIVDTAMLGANTVGLWPNPGAGAQVSLLAFVDGGAMTSDSDIPWGGALRHAP